MPIEETLGHRFSRPDLLREALTHRSAARRGPLGAASNERLEFMGDRVLGLLISEWLVERYPAEQEGELGRRLAYLVSQPVLATVAEGDRTGGGDLRISGRSEGGGQEARDRAGGRLGSDIRCSFPGRRTGSGTCVRTACLGAGDDSAIGAAQGCQDHAPGMGSEAGAGVAELRSCAAIRSAARASIHDHGVGRRA